MDWVNSRIRSERHKTGTGSDFWFELWSETFRLLKLFWNDGELALVSEEGTPLWCDEDDSKQKDIVGNQFRSRRKKAPALKGCRYKDSRETGMTRLAKRY